jgi:phosphoserine phosphatase
MTPERGPECTVAPVPALTSWNEGLAKRAILDFVAQTESAGVPAAERVAVFDNDGTLWCEQPMPIQADFIVRRLAEMAAADPGLRDRQPWRAAYEHDLAWFGAVLVEHYAGDDTNVRTLLGGVLTAYASMSVDEFEARSEQFLRTTTHPTLGRRYLECAYAPMLELLAYLAEHGFASYIASGGGRDFMRPISQEVYGIPRERVIGSASALEYVPDDHGGVIRHKAEADYLDDGAQKPVRIWSRTGRRPMLAAGNSNGDIPMLDFTQDHARPHLRLLVCHDDADREFSYTAGAEQALAKAAVSGWTPVSIRADWARVF